MSELSPTASAPGSPSSGETKAARHIRHAAANARYLREMMPPAVKAEGGAAAASKRAGGGTAQAADSFMVVEARAAPRPKQAPAQPAAPVASPGEPLSLWFLVPGSCAARARQPSRVPASQQALCCDSCGSWFSTRDVGLTVAEAVDLEVWSCTVCTQLQAQTGISPAARALQLLRGAMGERAVDVVFQDPGHLGLVFPQVGLSPAACAGSSARLSRRRCAQGVIPLTVARVEDGLAKVPQRACSPALPIRAQTLTAWLWLRSTARICRRR